MFGKGKRKKEKNYARVRWVSECVRVRKKERVRNKSDRESDRDSGHRIAEQVKKKGTDENI